MTTIAIPGVRRVRGTGDLTSPAPLEGLIARVQCELAETPDRLIVDLRSVCAADTKLIASLVFLSVAAAGRQTALEILVSESVHRWIVLCRLDFLMRSVRQVSDKTEAGRADGEHKRPAPADRFGTRSLRGVWSGSTI